MRVTFYGDLENMMDRHVKSNRQPIPKPKGVVGRIKEGGYSLIKVLGWE